MIDLEAISTAVKIRLVFVGCSSIFVSFPIPSRSVSRSRKPCDSGTDSKLRVVDLEMAGSSHFARNSCGAIHAH